MMRNTIKHGLLILVILFTVYGCELFSPDIGGENQPCDKENRCEAGLVCDTRDYICVTPATLRADGDFDKAEIADGCDCAEGPCCTDGCHYDDTDTLCQENISGSVEYGCSSQDCGGDVQKHYRNRYCNGESDQCRGRLEWGNWTVTDDCGEFELCDSGLAACKPDREVCDPSWCDAGPCCDTVGKTIRSDTHVCNEQAAIDYACSDGTGCGLDAMKRVKKQYCSGDDPDCSGDIDEDWSDWTLHLDCTAIQICVEDAPNPASCADNREVCDPTYCDSGTCCDTETQTIRSTDTICETDVADTDEYRCASTACGANLDVRYKDRYCDGERTDCSGALSFSGWRLKDDCEAIEKCNAESGACVPDRPNCDTTYCPDGSGPCCDDATNSFYDTTQICAVSASTEYGCPDGTGCGDDVKIHTKDRHCSGTSSLCDGELDGVWSDWSLYTGCTELQVCEQTAPGQARCNEDRTSCDPSYCADGSGPCCDEVSNTLFGTARTCEALVSTAYRCQPGCGGNVEHEITDRHCDGLSTACEGALVARSWETDEDCLQSETCNDQTFGCADTDSCHTDYCESGDCCDLANNTVYGSDYVCATNLDEQYRCASTDCGADVERREQVQHCTGLSTVCEGALAWTDWAQDEDCELSETCDDLLYTCTVNRPLCDVTYCTAGDCCDTETHTVYGTDHLCQEDVAGTATRRCTSTDCGGDLEVKYKDRYCSGSDDECNGALQDGAWRQEQDCTTAEVCNVGSASCVADRPTCDPTYCAYNAGPCCDNATNTLREATYICLAAIATEYGCPDGSGCSADVKVRTQDQYCTGTSALCDGLIPWTTWAIADDCEAFEVCVPGNPDCQLDRQTCDSTYCTSGDCCNTGTSTLYGTDQVCLSDAEEEYGCPDGTGCGDDLKVHRKDKHCDGVVASCNGSLGDWKAWVLADNCDANTEVCVAGQTTCTPDRATCDSTYCASGDCCNTATDTIYGSDHVCQEDATSEFGCPDGTGCGDDLKKRYKDKYCTGSHADCTAFDCPCAGSLGSWKSWQLEKDCTTSQQCNAATPDCDAHIFHDEVRCDGLDRYYYNSCDVQEDYIDTCDACTVDACAPAGCSTTTYSCNGHGTCNVDDNVCTCTDPAYTGDYCNQCATGYYEYPASSGICVDDPCDPDPCNGHGTCDNNTGLAVCDCDSGYSGSPCDACHVDAFGEYPYCFLPQTGYCTTSNCFRILPTSQKKCYTWQSPWEEATCPGSTPAICGSTPALDGCGQDAQYPDPTKVYTCYNAAGVETACTDLPTASDNEVVVDSLTGLMWQRYIPDTYAGCSGIDLCNWQDASNYCDNLNYGSHQDWRLPSVHELHSIVDYSTYDLTINDIAFPSSPSYSYYATSSILSGGHFFIDFQWGESSTSASSGALYQVRCVRGGYIEASDGSSDNFFYIEGVDPVVLDSVTGLFWTSNAEFWINWKEALAYCEELDYAGNTDWRLPSINELLTLIEINRSYPASHFPNMSSVSNNNILSSTTIYKSSTSFVIRAILADGQLGGYYKTDSDHFVYCVRGGLGVPCNDGNPCTYGETYDFFGNCQGETSYSCDANEVCDGLGGCPCDTGYYEFPADSGTCIDDPCDPDPDICNGHGTCDNSTGVATCDCDPGFINSACDACHADALGEYPLCFAPGPGFCDTNQCFRIPPTGQTACYDASGTLQNPCPGSIPAVCGDDPPIDYCGQDAQYLDNARTFTCYNAAGVETPCASLPTASEDEVVVDSLTGLMWQRTTVANNTWQAAMDYCDTTMNESGGYAGYTGWHLPNVHELSSIVDCGTSFPALDATVFPQSAHEFWTSVLSLPTGDTEAWVVHFDYGHSDDLNKGLTYYARCVRGILPPTGSGASDRYIESGGVGAEIVTDKVTGLIWRKSPIQGRTWRQAMAECEELNYASQTDWRMPDKNELASLINYENYAPSSDFPNMLSEEFWSSSYYAYDTSDVWIVDFFFGFVTYTGKGTGASTLCVRGGPGVSCDDGDACTYGETYDFFGSCQGATAYTCNGHGTCNGNDLCTCDARFGGDFCDQCASGFEDYPNCTSTGFVSITADTFWMGSPDGSCPGSYPASCIDEPGRGSEEELHEVTLTYNFEIQATEMTQGEYETLIGSNPSYFSQDGAGADCGSGCPVEMVTWDEALNAANAKSAAAGLSECFDCSGVPLTCTLNAAYTKPQDCPGYRLPTEAEWEFAARATTYTAYYNGAVLHTSDNCGTDDNLRLIGWYCDNEGGITHETGMKINNDWNLFDTSGNVAEWTWDWAAPFGTGSETDPVGPGSSTHKVARGGHIYSYPRDCRSAKRYTFVRDHTDAILGFRLVRTIP